MVRATPRRPKRPWPEPIRKISNTMKIIAAGALSLGADDLKTLQIANDADLAALAAEGALEGVQRIEL